MMSCDLIPPTPFSIARLRLRRPKLEDASHIFAAYAQDQEVVCFLAWKVHRSEQETLGFLKDCLVEWAKGTGFPYAIELVHNASGPIGMIRLHRKFHVMRFGYVLARPYWGQGYMTEALSAVVAWSLHQREIWRASATCDVDNIASTRVMEKAGMTFEGILRRYFVHPNISCEPRDCRLYAITRE